MKYIVETLTTYLDLPSEDIKPESELRNLVEDSLDFVEMILYLEDCFLVDIKENDLNNIITVKDLSDYIDSNLSSISER